MVTEIKLNSFATDEPSKSVIFIYTCDQFHNIFMSVNYDHWIIPLQHACHNAVYFKTKRAYFAVINCACKRLMKSIFLFRQRQICRTSHLLIHFLNQYLLSCSFFGRFFFFCPERMTSVASGWWTSAGRTRSERGRWTATSWRQNGMSALPRSVYLPLNIFHNLTSLRPSFWISQHLVTTCHSKGGIPKFRKKSARAGERTRDLLFVYLSGFTTVLQWLTRSIKVWHSIHNTSFPS